MKTKLLLITFFVILCLGLIAESKESTDFKNCKDCCIDGNCKDGIGTWTYANGDKYTGEYLDGKKEGDGVYIYVNGDTYLGEFEDDNLNGEGIYSYSNGDKFQGEYDSGIRNGVGTYSYANGEKFSGEFKNGKPNGIGTYTYTDGENYFGEWTDGKRNGDGIYTFSRGKKLIGQWSQGQFKNPNQVKEMKLKSKEWSAYQGYMNWSEAKEKCNSIQMRLPRRRELRKAFKTKTLGSWKTDGTYYWTSDEYNAGSAFYYFVDRGILDSFTKDVARHVRCVR